MLAAALGSGCAAGDGSTSNGQLSAGSIGGTAGDGGSGSESESSSGSSDDGAGTADGTGAADTSGTAAESTGPVASCVDGMTNGDETDIDCGGSCPQCAMGHACTLPVDCATAVCEGGVCCTSTTYDRTTGLVSGSASVCCDGDDARLSLQMCGDGQNYTVQEEGANCASTSEGAMNNGSACVSITCQMLACDPA